MKNLFLLMASSLLLFASCSLNVGNEGNDPETRRRIIATSMHNSNMGQILVCLDPFNLAFRLNTLMIESEAYEGNVNDNALAKMREDLFGTSTTITSDNEGVYTLVLKGQGKQDYLHSGTLVIQTNGSTLSNGNTWSLSIPKTAEYSFSMSGTTVALYTDSYTITSTEDNKWEIQIRKLVSNQPETDYTETKSDWSGKITMTQDKFTDQTLNSISKSTYTMEVESAYQITTMYVTDTMSVQTIDPLVFNPECGQSEIVGAGSMRSAFTYPWSDPLDFTLSEWKGEGTECDPEIEVQYYGVVQE